MYDSLTSPNNADDCLFTCYNTLLQGNIRQGRSSSSQQQQQHHLPPPSGGESAS